MRYRLRSCCLQGLKIRSMETKRFGLRLLISQALLGEKSLETRRAELCRGCVLGLPPPWHPAFATCYSLVPKGGQAQGARAGDVNHPAGDGRPGAGGRSRVECSVCTGATSHHCPPAREVGKGLWGCACVGRSKPRGELLPLHCKLFGGESIHFLGSGCSGSLNTFLFPCSSCSEPTDTKERNVAQAFCGFSAGSAYAPRS